MREHQHYIFVPKTLEAMYEQEKGKWSPNDYYLWGLAEDEFNSLNTIGRIINLELDFTKSCQ